MDDPFPGGTVATPHGSGATRSHANLTQSPSRAIWAALLVDVEMPTGAEPALYVETCMRFLVQAGIPVRADLAITLLKDGKAVRVNRSR